MTTWKIDRFILLLVLCSLRLSNLSAKINVEPWQNRVCCIRNLAGLNSEKVLVCGRALFRLM